MTRSRLTPVHRLIMSVPIALAIALLGIPAPAGPAKYDPKTRSFQLNYTYAALPYFNMTPEQIDGLGQLQTATADQEAKVRALYQSVSQILEEVTNKRARIGSFEYVESIKKADVIISLTGLFERAGWSTLGTIEGQPGQVGLYYLYLDQKPPQEVALTIAHELCHYLFALPDEYSSNSQPECPLQNPTSPGCLMDNYFLRHGFRRLCTDDDHNADGPRQNPGTILSGHRAEDSCQLWIENFFKAHPPDPAVDKDGDGIPDPPNSDQSVTVAEPFSGQFRQLVNSATLFVRDKVDADRKKLGDKARFPEATALATMAETFLKNQLKELANDPGFLAPNAAQVKAATAAVAQRILSQPIKPPTRFSGDLVTRLKARAVELATATPRKSNELLQLLVSSQPSPAKDLKPVIEKVAKGLFDFLVSNKALLGMSLTALAPEEKRYVEQIAREAVAGPGGTSEFGTFLEAAKLHIRLSLNSTKTLNQIAGELDLPGSRARKLDLSDLQTQLDKFRLPGKPFTGFGFRRTYVVAPHPIDPRFDRIWIDAGDNLAYHDIRNLAVSQFMRLVQRERTEFVNDPLTPDPIAIQRLDALALNLPLKVASRTLASGERTAKQNELIAKVVEAVRRDRVENVVFLAPPGGLTEDLGEALEEFRAIVLDDSDVRVDVVILGSGTIPLRLRDLAAQTGGSVQVGADIDEVGAISQRLKNEIAAGSWVSIPQRGYIDFSATSATGSSTLRGQARLAPKSLPTLASLQERFKGREHYNRARRDDPNNCEETSYLTEKGTLKPSFDLSLDELELFRERLNVINSNFVRTEARGTFSPIFSSLYRLSSDIEKMGRDLDEMVTSRPGEETHQKLHHLLDSVYSVKQSLRPIFGSTTLFRAPLTSTDDYMDWSLRKLLVQEAHELTKRSDEALSSPNKNTTGQTNKDVFIRLRLKASDFLERASEQNQTLTDLTESLSVVENRILSARYNRAKGFFVDDDKLPLKEAKTLLSLVERRQREEAARNADASPLLLEATGNELRVCEELNSSKSPRAKVGSTSADREYEEFRIALVQSSARFLERASSQAIDPVQFGNEVARLRVFLDEIIERARQDVNSTASTQLGPIADLVKLLETRSERLIGRGGVVDPLVGATGRKSSFEDEEVFDKSNALTPLIDSLLTNRYLWTALPALEEVLKNKKCKNQQLYSLLYLLKDDHPDVVRDRVEEFVHGDFPLLILNVLGRLRDFEESLQAVEAAYHDAKRPIPTFERLVRPGIKARPDLDQARDGHLVGISFEPFQVEEAAEMELIIGLSRPLRKFEQMRDSPPSLKLFRGASSENLTDSPYLAFDAEFSTDTMLVYRVPKPNLRAGYLKAGQYTPRLLVDQKYMPILGRDNTVNYTFSVATIRPNVQLIAALRQPQPKDGDVQFGKDKQDAYRGTLAANVSEAIVEVQVLSGAPVVNADVSGIFQRIDATTRQINSPKIDFVDDGLYPDLKKDDGVYTGRIALQPLTARKPSEYRIFVQARSTDTTKYIPLAEPIPGKVDPGTAKDSAIPKVLPFQRATSLNFHASGEN